MTPWARCAALHSPVLRGLAWLLLMMVAAAHAPAFAQALESVLSPGRLIQGHAKWDDDCKACHVRFDRAAQDGLCMDCHKDIGRDVRARSGHHGRLRPQPCRTCHTDHKGRDRPIAAFDQRQFDHAATDFALQGGHRGVDCAKCHEPGRKYSAAPSDCNACHRKDDVHKGSLGARCADCHTDGRWKEAKLDHDKTRFALTGRHADVKCADCHRNTAYRETPRDCAGCHRKDDDGPKGHRGQFGEKCESCHGTKAWKPSTFNHDTDTRWALRARHRTVRCADCHTGALYRVKTPTDCYSCHRKDDKHKDTLGRDCGACHTERDWKEQARFDHDRTKFALLGRHAEARCDACHKSKVFNEAPTECIGCHRKDDKHEGTLGEDCKACHGERDWKSTRGRFDHGRTKFPLLGKHVDARCEACHQSRRYGEAPKECVGCHRKEDKHEGTLGEDCKACHGERDWKSTRGLFDHDRTKFRLRNAHAAPALQCSACHDGLKGFRRTPLDCYGCHRKDDRHEGQSGRACESCHDDRSWKVPGFDHARTRYPLVGRHLATACKECHATPRFKDAPGDCLGCHRKDDKHKLAFGAKCESCHNARAWSLWDFDHNRRGEYRLDGAHRKVACEACHTSPAPAGRAFAALPSACSGCHRKDDVHDASFGMRCEQCHVTERWKKVLNRTMRSSRGPAAEPPPPAGPGAAGVSGQFVRAAARQGGIGGLP